MIKILLAVLLFISAMAARDCSLPSEIKCVDDIVVDVVIVGIDIVTTTAESCEVVVAGRVT